jgi:hypothetical protein
MQRKLEALVFCSTFLLRTVLQKPEVNYCSEWFVMQFIGFGNLLPLLILVEIGARLMKRPLDHLHFLLYLIVSSLPTCFFAQWMLVLWR